MKQTFKIDNWSTQLNKGFLELCVLLILQKKQPCFGSEIIALLKEKELTVMEGTLYPLLNRMHENSWLETYWQVPENKGHPKKLYTINQQFENQIDVMLTIYLKNEDTIWRLKND